MAAKLAPVPPAWADSLSRFEVELSGQPLSASTVAQRMRHVQKFALAMPVSPDRLNREHVMSYMAKSNWRRSAETYNGVRQHVGSYLAFAFDRGVIPTNLARILPPPRRREKRVTRAVPQSIVRNALATPNDRDRLMVLMAALGGLKPGEIAQVHSDQLEETVDGEFRLHARQTSGNVRAVLLRDDLAAAIRVYGEGYIFPGKKDGHISSAYVSRLISSTLPKGYSALALRQAFEAYQIRLSWRELASYHSPHSMRITELPNFRDSQKVAGHLAKIEAALQRGASDSAINASKNLLEAVFKVVLADAGVAYEKDKLPAMFNKVQEVIANAADDPIRGSIRTIGRSMAATVQSLAEIRNDASDGHDSDVSADPRHARIVFNATVTVVEYVADTWRASEPSPA